MVCHKQKSESNKTKQYIPPVVLYSNQNKMLVVLNKNKGTQKYGCIIIQQILYSFFL
jgi:hypothetical protein